MKKIIWILIPLVLILLLVPFLKNSNSDSGQSEFEETIDSRTRFLEFNEESPFKQFNIDFQKPIYHTYNPDYRVQARVEKITERELVVISTSTGSKEKYLKYAWLNFSLDGQKLRLLVLKPFGFGALDVLYLAFADETSGTSTYGGGRYIEITKTKSEKIILDFNLAYNPYCAYIPEYECPLPPAENILPVAINAGEKDYKK